MGQKGASFTIDREQLPSGAVRFQLLGIDGFHTVMAETETVELPSKPPAVAIFYPRPSARVYPERQIRLVGSASSFQGGVITEIKRPGTSTTDSPPPDSTFGSTTPGLEDTPCGSR